MRGEERRKVLGRSKCENCGRERRQDEGEEAGVRVRVRACVRRAVWWEEKA